MKNFEETLKENMKNFVEWATVVTDLLKRNEELKFNIGAIDELDLALDNLKATNIQMENN